VRKQNDINDGAVDDVAEGLLDVLSDKTPGTNMSMERLLSLIRAAVRQQAGRKPRASKVISHGYLAQLMRQHLGKGLPDNRGKAHRKATNK